MGSGGMIVMDENTCMADVSRYFIDFLRDESCGKCTSCREGLQAMYDVLTDICEGQGKETDIEFLQELSEGIMTASLCQLGQTAPNLVLTTLRYFRDEYEAHINRKKCPAGVCKALIQYRIDTQTCKGCMLCNKQCPQDAISGEVKEPQLIDDEACIKCGVCRESCKFDAVLVE
jgi:NAD-dependent dihydropyrimidine dehydrogenase PreA subunit